MERTLRVWLLTLLLSGTALAQSTFRFEDAELTMVSVFEPRYASDIAQFPRLNTVDPGPVLVRTLLRFELSRIPIGTDITAARLVLNTLNRSDGTLAVYEAGAAWSETSATWVERFPGAPWVRPGGDRVGSALASGRPGAVGADHTVSLSAGGVGVVRRWVDDPASNAGFLLEMTGGALDAYQFRVHGSSTGGPRLELDFADGGGSVLEWTSTAPAGFENTVLIGAPPSQRNQLNAGVFIIRQFTDKDAMALLRVDLSRVPPGSRVLSGQLRLGLVSTLGDGASYHATFMRSPWSADAVTWTQRLADAGWVNPGISGADVTSNGQVTGTLADNSTEDVLPFTSAASVAELQRWVDAPSANQGLRLASAPTNLFGVELARPDGGSRSPYFLLTVLLPDAGLDASVDAGEPDAGSADDGGADSGEPVDAGPADAGSSDAGGVTDADGGDVDGGDVDGGDVGGDDAGRADAGLSDAGFDAGLGGDDAGTRPVEREYQVGVGCEAGVGAWSWVALSWVMGVALLRRAPRRGKSRAG